MRPLAACLLLTVLVPCFAADVSTMAAHADAKADSKVIDRAEARSAASAAVPNSRRKSDMKWTEGEATGQSASHVDMAKAEARAKAEAKAKAEGKGQQKAVERPAPKAAPPTGGGRDQSVCDLSPHPSWCDQ